jgi:CBS domain-containing protein
MANAREILGRKGGDVITVDGGATVVDAARLMNDHHIGSLVVLVDGRLAGIFTERDVMRRVVAEGRSPETTSVSDVMTRSVACAAPETAYTELCEVMRERRIRHLPVIDGDDVIGMISIGDLNRAEHHEQERTIRYLEQYISVS